MTHAFIGGDAKKDEHIVGNEYLHVLRIEPIDSGFRAFVCDNTFGVYRQMVDEQSYTPLRLALSHSPSAADTYNLQVWRIEFTDQRPGGEAGAPEVPTVPQEGPRPSPAADVFGPWFATGIQGARFWYDADNPGVESNSPEEDANRLAARSTVLDNPPQMQPAVPGWPETE